MHRARSRTQGNSLKLPSRIAGRLSSTQDAVLGTVPLRAFKSRQGRPKARVHALSFNSNWSAGEKTYARIIVVLISEVSPDEARIMAITTN